MTAIFKTIFGVSEAEELTRVTAENVELKKKLKRAAAEITELKARVANLDSALGHKNLSTKLAS